MRALRCSRPYAHGVAALVVKNSVPTEILKRNLHSFGHLRRKGGEQPSPAFGVVIAEPDSVLPPQGEDGQPEVAGVVGHLLRRLGQRRRICARGKQAVRPQLLGAGAVGDVVQILFPARHLVQMFFNDPGDQLRGMAPGGRRTVVLVLEHPSAVREIPQQVREQRLLF